MVFTYRPAARMDSVAPEEHTAAVRRMDCLSVRISAWRR